jgi:hypothetical protein
MNFDKWFKKLYPGMELSPWQEKAMREFLFSVYPYRENEFEMSFATEVLRKFVATQGKEFEL